MDMKLKIWFRYTDISLSSVRALKKLDFLDNNPVHSEELSFMQYDLGQRTRVRAQKEKPCCLDEID